MSDQYDETWTASADELAALQDLQAQLAAQREQTAAERAAALQELAGLTAARGEVQGQTRGLEGDVGSFRAEQKLAADAAHTLTAELVSSQGGDFYSPDVGQTIAPDGTVTYDFDAHLHARGIDLDAVYQAGESHISWLRTTDGALVAQLEGFEDTPTTRTWRAMGMADSTKVTTTQLRSARVDVTNRDGVISATAGGGVVSQVTARGGAFERVIIDENDKSGYPRWAGGTLAAKIAFGRATVTWGAAGTASAVANIAHGLGIAPTTVVLTCGMDSAGFGNCWAVCAGGAGINTTGFPAIAYSPNALPAGASVPVFWVAIG